MPAGVTGTCVVSGQSYIVMAVERRIPKNKEDEIILAVPGDRIGELVAGVRQSEERGMGYAQANMLMLPDFPQPDFYKRLFVK